MYTDYYSILGVDKSASNDEIKRAYRKKALRFHPDKSRDPEANKQFSLISEAYETLSDPEKRDNYDYVIEASLLELLMQMYEVTESSAHKSYSRRENTAQRQNFTQSLSQPFDFSAYAPYSRVISAITFIFCLLLCADYISAINYPNETVSQKTYEAGLGLKNKSFTVHTAETPDAVFPLDAYKYHYIDQGDTVNVFTTPILQITTRVDRLRKSSIFSFAPHYSIYNVFLFLPLILLVISSCGLFILQGPEQVFNAGLACSLLMPILLYLLAIS
jgi:hypothetical protein